MIKVNVSPNVITLREIMKAADVSQSELAQRMGVTRQSVSLWFSGGMPLDRYFEAVLLLTPFDVESIELDAVGRYLTLEVVEDVQE